jgi:uncharacterized membrane protein
MPAADMVIEASAYLLFALTVWTAWRRSAWDLMVVLCGALFGLAIELMFVHLAGGYKYGDFAVMLGGAPLWVACGWGLIIYACCSTASELDVEGWGKPATAALMAVSLDFALDPIAESLGWWNWLRPDPGFFGVSYDNFVGWLLIVGSYCAFCLLWRGKAWAPPVSLLLAASVVAACTPVLEALYPHLGEGLVFYVVHTGFLATALAARWRKVAWYRVVMPVYLHGLFLALLVFTGLAEQHPELYGVFAMASSVSLLWFWGYSRSEMQ